MASVYDAILVKGSLRYRLNKVFIAEDKVPENIKKLITVDNIVDENGMILVDQKTPDAKQAPAEDGEENKTKLVRVDSKEATEDPAVDPVPKVQDTPPTEADKSVSVQVDDSANEDQEGEDDATSTSDPAADPAKDTTPPVAQAAPQAPEQAPAPEAAPQPAPEVPQRPARAAQPKEPLETFRSKVPQSTPGMGFPRKHGKTVDIFDLKTPHTHVKHIGGLAVPLSAESFKTRSEGQIMTRLRELGYQVIDFNKIDREEAIAGTGGANVGRLFEDEEVEDDIKLG